MNQPIIVEQSFDVSKENLWMAITEHDQMVKWFFEDIPEFKPEAGFTTQFNVNAGGRDFLQLWKITEAIDNEKIVYDWRYEGYPGAGTVTFELFEEGDGSRLRVTNEGVKSFPQEIPEFSPESCESGWNYLLQESLKNYLATLG